MCREVDDGVDAVEHLRVEVARRRVPRDLADGVRLAPHEVDDVVKVVPQMWRDAWLVAGRDLRIELRSRVGLWQVLPFALLTLVLFAFALGPQPATLARSAPGLFWLAVLFSSVLAAQRSMAIEGTRATKDVSRLLGLDPAGVFLGKVLALLLEIIALEAVLLLGVVLFSMFTSARGLTCWLLACSPPSVSAQQMCSTAPWQAKHGHGPRCSHFWCSPQLHRS